MWLLSFLQLCGVLHKCLKKKKTSKYQKCELRSSRKVEQQLREARLLPTQRRLRFPPRGAAGNGAAQRGSATAEAECPLLPSLSAGGAIWHPYLPASPAEMPSFTRGLVVFPSFPQGFSAKREKGACHRSWAPGFLYKGKLWLPLAVGLRWQKTPHGRSSKSPPLQLLQSCTLCAARHGWITAQMGSLVLPDRSTTAPSPLPLNGNQLFPPRNYVRSQGATMPLLETLYGMGAEKRWVPILSSTQARPAQHMWEERYVPPDPCSPSRIHFFGRPEDAVQT